ncbi:MAG: glycosyltransferase family 4 protein [Alphaproteobacteria bacterium]|nr:glycosyltransferase family 4 protein [Alphaproteobacteria bacterium]
MSTVHLHPAEVVRVTPPQRQLRFERVAISCVFGDPSEPRTWSGAPFNLAAALRRLGIEVEAIHPALGRARRAAYAARWLLDGYGRLSTSEQVLRAAPARDHHAIMVAEATARLGLRHVLHTGTLDLPAFDLLPDIRHYLYCDQSWNLSLRHRPDAAQYTPRALAEYERLERESLASVAHVFTFSGRTRDDIVEHYGLPAERVTVVGSGMGGIAPYLGPKDYRTPRLLFVAKHLFRAKGGPLLLRAFALARRSRPDLSLTIVGDARSRAYVPRDPRIVFFAHVTWDALRRLYADATLLAQPMINDPWGQVYLEALASRTPVLGLNRNGLPEIVEGGRHGFLVDEATPEAVAAGILSALSDPARLQRMGESGQRHVITTYSWDRVAERIAYL